MIRRRNLFARPAMLWRLSEPLRIGSATSRRAVVVGAATTWLLLMLLPRQPDGQWVYLSQPGRSDLRAVVVPVDAPQTQQLRQIACRLAEPASGSRSAAYCQARWRFEAATHYIQQLQATAPTVAGVHPDGLIESVGSDVSTGAVAPIGRGGAIRGEVGSHGDVGPRGGAVAAVSFESPLSPNSAVASDTRYGIAYWQAHRAAAHQQMQQLLAAVGTSAEAPMTIRFGAVRPGLPRPSAALLAVAAGCVAAMLHGFRRRRPARLPCYAHCRLSIPAAWMRIRPSAEESMRRWSYRGAWLIIIVCAAVRWV